MNYWKQRNIISRPLDKSLIYSRKRRGPRIDPWGTRAFTSLQDECWPFKTTLCFLEFKRSFESSSNLPDMPFFWSLNIRLSCHTLSNAFDVSKNTRRTSKPSSKDLYISWVIERSWLMQESPPLNPDWCDDIILLSIRYG